MNRLYYYYYNYYYVMSCVSTFLVLHLSFTLPSEIHLALLLFVSISNESCCCFLAHVACPGGRGEGVLHLIYGFWKQAAHPHPMILGVPLPPPPSRVACQNLCWQGLCKGVKSNKDWHTRGQFPATSFPTSPLHVNYLF